MKPTDFAEPHRSSSAEGIGAYPWTDELEGTAADAVVPFTIAIPEAAIADLHERLDMTRWPSMPAAGWSHGQPVSLIRELVAAWRSLDWRAVEARLNASPQFVTRIDSQRIHFIHVRSKVAGAFPLVLTHGWPTTPLEFAKVIGPLTDPAAHGLDPSIAFDLVIPSLPGYGFSGAVTAPGWDVARVAKAWDVLMKRLGYERYGAFGADVGALVTRELGILAPAGLAGIQVQQIFAFPTGADGEMDELTPFEREGFANAEYFMKYAGYNDIQSKRPGTLAYGIVDSPAGMLAWLSELWVGFEGQGVEALDRDAFLTDMSIYWFTATAGSAANLYLENAITGAGYRELPNPTPTAGAIFPDDFRSVRTFAARSNNIVRWSEMPRGGHFAAGGEPDLLAQEMRAFFPTVA